MALPQAGRFVGNIKNWNPEKGWGFVECQETYDVYGKDIFVMRSAMPTSVSTVSRGDPVSFTVQPGTKGPEAAAVQFLSGGAYVGVSRAQASPTVSVPPMRPKIPTPVTSMMAPPPTAMGGMLSAGVYIGSVKNWNPQKGWGFIQCEATEQIYGKDIFVMKSAVAGGGNLSPGERVQFSVKMGIKGIEAGSVNSVGPSPMQPPMPMPMPMPAPSQHHSSMGASGTSPGSLTGQTFFGVVKSYNEDKGWGHIDCAGTRKVFEKDMFMMRSSLNGQTVSAGSQVSFKVAMGLKGPEASEVSVMPRGSFSLGDGMPSNLFSGRIKNFNAEKGWGFIMGDDVQKVFGKDIFVHGRELHGQVPATGEGVQFTVIINSQGRPEAATVSLGGDGLPDGYHAAAQTNGAGFVSRSSPY